MQILRKIEDGLMYVGADDHKISMFESTLEIAHGVSYNSYLFLDEKTCLMDTADQDVTRQFLENVEGALGGRKLDYLVIHHMEPDHCYNVSAILSRHPETKVVSNAKVFTFLRQFFPEMDFSSRSIVVKEGDSLSLGRHTIRFYLTPMVHWPEVMMSYEESEGLLFTADAFGTFGTLDGNLFASDVDFDRELLGDARTYYTNIVGKYGSSVQMAFKKLPLDKVKMILPLHGPIWKEKEIPYILDKYQKWSTYTPEKKGVLILFASMYGDTENAAVYFANLLAEKGVKDLHVYDLSRTPMDELVGLSFEYSNIALFAPTYNLTLYPSVDTYLTDILRMGLTKRTFTLVGNGTWAPVERKLMVEKLSTGRGNTILPTELTILSALKKEDLPVLNQMAEEVVDSLK